MSDYSTLANPVYQCQHCGKSFRGHKRKYCERYCKAKKTCRLCGTEFMGRRGAAVCGLRCVGTHGRKRPAKTIECKRCGKAFRKFEKGGVARTAFCSKVCRRDSWSESAKVKLRRREEKRSQRLADTVESRRTRRLRSCIVCGNQFETREDGRNKTCSDECFDKQHRKNKKDARRRRRARKKGVAHEAYQPIDIFVRDNWKCWLCGNKANKTKRAPDPSSPSIDHVIPLSKGGPDIPDNLHCACFGCNRSKRDIVVTLW